MGFREVPSFLAQLALSPCDPFPVLSGPALQWVEKV